MIIENGVGDGTKAKVDDRNALLTTAIAIQDETFVSLEDSQAFSVETGLLTIPATFDGPVILLRNLDGQRDIIITAVSAEIDAPSAGAYVSAFRNPTVGTLVNNVAKAPLNLNFESGQVPNVEAYIWDGVGVAGITGITPLADGTFGPSPMAQKNIAFAPFVLGQNNLAVINIQSGVAGFDLNSQIRFYFDTSGAK